MAIKLTNKDDKRAVGYRSLQLWDLVRGHVKARGTDLGNYLHKASRTSIKHKPQGLGF